MRALRGQSALDARPAVIARDFLEGIEVRGLDGKAIDTKDAKNRSNSAYTRVARRELDRLHAGDEVTFIRSAHYVDPRSHMGIRLI